LAAATSAQKMRSTCSALVVIVSVGVFCCEYTVQPLSPATQQQPSNASSTTKRDEPPAPQRFTGCIRLSLAVMVIFAQPCKNADHIGRLYEHSLGLSELRAGVEEHFDMLNVS
jgi:hypothetical protein